MKFVNLTIINGGLQSILGVPDMASLAACSAGNMELVIYRNYQEDKVYKPKTAPDTILEWYAYILELNEALFDMGAEVGEIVYVRIEGQNPFAAFVRIS